MTDKSPERLSEDQNWVRSTQVDRRAAILGSAVLTGYALAAQPVAASAITTDVTGLDAGMTSFQTAGLRMNAYRAKPSGKRNLPVVIVVQEIFGLHEWVKDICRRYAKAGFYAIAPDLYQRQGDATKIADFKVLIGDIVSKVPDAQVMGDLDAVAQFAGTDGGNAAKLGITGFCWGGRIVWLYAAHNPRLKAGVACYGRVVGQPTVLQPKESDRSRPCNQGTGPRALWRFGQGHHPGRRRDDERCAESCEKAVDNPCLCGCRSRILCRLSPELQ